MSKLVMTGSMATILRLLAGYPSGGCSLTWLPSDLDFKAYLECREAGLCEEQPGRGGFIDTFITPKGRRALSAFYRAHPTP